MKTKITALLLPAVLYSGLSGQTPTDLNEGLRIQHDPVANLSEPFTLTFWGRPNFYYFTLQTSDLRQPWTYYDFAIKGNAGVSGFGEVEGFTFGSSTQTGALFLRMELTDDPNHPTLLADFDGDFVTNKAELDQGTDVFEMLFSDPDLLADEWELLFFGDLSQGDSGNDDSDYLNNLEESQVGLDPTADERGLAIEYTYDALGRLTAVSGNATTLSYSLDEEGNLLIKE